MPIPVSPSQKSLVLWMCERHYMTVYGSFHSRDFTPYPLPGYFDGSRSHARGWYCCHERNEYYEQSAGSKARFACSPAPVPP